MHHFLLSTLLILVLFVQMYGDVWHVDTVARLMSGMQASSSDPMALDIENSQEWREGSEGKSAKYFWNLLNRVDYKNQLSAQFSSRSLIQSFLKENFEPAYSTTKNVVYLFGGPDFSYADLFFPNMESLVIVGQEPIGVILDPEKLLQQGSLKEMMFKMGTSLSTIPFKGYYVTETMLQELGEYGVAMLLSISIILADHCITACEIFYLDPEGNIPCVSFTYRKKGDTVDRRVLYLQYNLFSQPLASAFIDLMTRSSLDTAF